LVTSYLIYAVPVLGRLWIWIQVPVVTAFYMVLFVPAELGWDNAQMFAGMAVAVAMLWLFNNLLWPLPVSSVVAQSLAEAMERSRSRFARLTAIAAGDAEPEDDHPVASQFGRHVALLAQVHQVSSPAAFGELLARVIGAERIHKQLDSYASFALESAGAFPELNAAAGSCTLARAIDTLFERLISKLRQDDPNSANGSDKPSLRLSPLDPNAELKQLIADYPHLTQLAATVAPLASLLDEEWLDLPGDEVAISSDPSLSLHGANPFLTRFAARHTLALTLAFLLGLADNNVALHAAIWLLMLGGPPSHGGTLRKFTMRALGSMGALALAALGTIIVAPNYTSLAPYMAAIFMGVLPMTYIGEGGGILSYLAIGGTAFVIAYSGPGPRTAVLGSLWSVWGISVGMIIRAALTLMWREHPYRTLAEEFQAPFAAMLELMRPTDNGSDTPRRTAAGIRVLRSIQVMLGVADDALLEGHTSGIDPHNLLDALHTLLRLAFMLGRANLPSIAGESAISAPTLNAIRFRFETWQNNLQAEGESGIIGPAPLRRMIREAAVPSFNSEPDGPRSPSIRTEADRLLADLTLTLERQLSAISLS